MVFSTPAGQEIPASFFPQFPEEVAKEAAEELAKAAPDVDSTTCITRWCGEHCDYDMAIGALMTRDEGASGSP